MANNRVSLRRTHLFIAAIALAAQLHTWAQAPGRELLNSERIAATFGSYGVEVLEQNGTVRVSNLFSGEGEKRVTRTFAVVRYAPQLHPAVSEEHAASVAGGSIGAVFAAQGWELRKTHLHCGERPATAKLASLMRVAVGAPLAEHLYVLDVVKNGRVIEYAALVEVHHPDYLGLPALAAIYGEPTSQGRSELIAALQATAAERER